MAAVRRVHFAEYNARINTLGTGTVLPKYGTPLLAGILKERGYDSRLFLEGVSDMSFERLVECDALCLPLYAPIYNKVKAFTDRVRAGRPHLPIIVGGPHAALFPEQAVRLGDYVVRCEGDEALPELLECLSTGGDPRAVAGISFREDGRVVHTPERTPPAIPATAPDLSLIEGLKPARHGIGGHEVMNTLQTSRGCAFHCKFCPTSRLFGGSYRNRDADSVIADIRSKLPYGRIFLVVDNSFLSNRKRAAELLHRLAEEDLGAHLIVFERHDIGKDTELLRLMARAGVRCIIVGIESLADENLQLYDKRQTSSDVVRSVRNILDQGIHVLGTFVLGGDGDTKERADEVIDFVRATGISLNLFIVHDLEQDERKGLLIPLSRRFQTYYERADPENTDAYDYLTGNFVTYFPKRMKPSTLQACMGRIYAGAFSHRANLGRVASHNLFNSLFGVGHGYSMMRMAEGIAQVVDGYYMGYLREIEEGLYDENEVLIEERLAALDTLPIPRPLTESVDGRARDGLTYLMLLPGLVRVGVRAAQRRLLPGGAKAAPFPVP